jgi:hypothetical protein
MSTEGPEAAAAQLGLFPQRVEISDENGCSRFETLSVHYATWSGQTTA